MIKNLLKISFLDNLKIDWSNKLQTVPKLRTNRGFKSEYMTEQHLLSNMTKLEISHFAQFRCFTHQGRYSDLHVSVHERVCNICKSKEEGKYQELIQSSNTPELRHHMGK